MAERQNPSVYIYLREGDKETLERIATKLGCESLSDMMRKLADGVLRIDYATVKRTDEAYPPIPPIEVAEDTLSPDSAKQIRQLAIEILNHVK